MIQYWGWRGRHFGYRYVLRLEHPDVRIGTFHGDHFTWPVPFRPARRFEAIYNGPESTGGREGEEPHAERNATSPCSNNENPNAIASLGPEILQLSVTVYTIPWGAVDWLWRLKIKGNTRKYECTDCHPASDGRTSSCGRYIVAVFDRYFTYGAIQILPAYPLPRSPLKAAAHGILSCRPLLA